MRGRRLLAVLAAVLGILLLARAARADRFVLASGEVVEGQVLGEDERGVCVRLAVPAADGATTRLIQRAQIRSTEREAAPRDAAPVEPAPASATAAPPATGPPAAGAPVCERCGGARTIKCPECHGFGGPLVDCPGCGGKRRLPCDLCKDTPRPGFFECKACGGAGKVTEKCPLCGGAGHRTCTGCNGAGTGRCGVCTGSGHVRWGGTTLACTACNGSGVAHCGTCGGTGQMSCYPTAARACGACKGQGAIACDQCKGKRTYRCATCAGEGRVRATCVLCGGAKRVACPACDPAHAPRGLDAAAGRTLTAGLVSSPPEPPPLPLAGLIAALNDPLLTSLQRDARAKDAVGRRYEAVVEIDDIAPAPAAGDGYVLSGACGGVKLRCEFDEAAREALLPLHRGEKRRVAGRLLQAGAGEAALGDCALQ